LVLEDSKNIKSSAFVKDNKLIIHIANLKSNTISSKKIVTKRRFKIKELFNNRSYKKIQKYSKSIVIDPGHGGKDSGAVGYNRLQEKKAVLSIALKLKKILTKRGYRVYMTRSRDKFIDLKDRTHFANVKKADLFISIHANAIEGRKKFTLKGIETFYLSPARSQRAKKVAEKENRASLINMDILSKNTLLNFLNREKIIQSNKLAIDIQANILKSLREKYNDIKDGGVRPAPFWVLVGAGMPAVLVEVGYITNPTEAKRLFNPFYQNRIAKGFADGIESYFLKN
jgi:N-acetylmuramoyl-L-alanine amidase